MSYLLMSIEILRHGLLSSVQDSGRWKFQSIGVPVCGGMDDDALFIANVLVGNSPDEACLEFLSSQILLRFHSDCLIAFTGSGMEASIEDRIIPSYKAVFIPSGTTVGLIPDNSGMWSYMSVSGGIKIEKVMGSWSTYVAAKIGGVNGDPLKSNDIINLGLPPASSLWVSLSKKATGKKFALAKWGVGERQHKADIIHARIFEGPEWSLLSEESKVYFLTNEFKISPESNRVGYRLNGKKLERRSKLEMVSSAVTRGTIQLTNDGSLIILMADSPTIGGYPRIAQLLAVDISSVSQCRPGTTVRFKMVSFHDAERLYLKRESERKMLIDSIRLKLEM